MKIVINSCYGGFSLSNIAEKEYLKRIGKESYFYAFQLDGTYKKVSENSDDILTLTLTKDFGEIIRRGDIPNDVHFGGRDIKRNDPILVSIIENMGKKANGRYAELKVIEIPDGVDWEISEYDGHETIEEKHRSWC